MHSMICNYMQLIKFSIEQVALAWASSHYKLNPWKREEQHQATALGILAEWLSPKRWIKISIN